MWVVYLSVKFSFTLYADKVLEQIPVERVPFLSKVVTGQVVESQRLSFVNKETGRFELSCYL